MKQVFCLPIVCNSSKINIDSLAVDRSVHLWVVELILIITVYSIRTFKFVLFHLSILGNG